MGALSSPLAAHSSKSPCLPSPRLIAPHLLFIALKGCVSPAQQPAPPILKINRRDGVATKDLFAPRSLSLGERVSLGDVSYVRTRHFTTYRDINLAHEAAFRTHDLVILDDHEVWEIEHETPDIYEVGYRKPPKHSRFSKGVSGNPKGRPKVAPDFDTALLREAKTFITINENGRRMRVSKYEVVIKQLINNAMKGKRLTCDCCVMHFNEHQSRLLCRHRLTLTLACGLKTLPTNTCYRSSLGILRKRN
jgi:hypothetical protein